MKSHNYPLLLIVFLMASFSASSANLEGLSKSNREIRRGFQVYKQVCASCHGLGNVQVQSLTKSNGPAFNIEELITIDESDSSDDSAGSDTSEYYKGYKIEDTNENGEVVERDMVATDNLPNPYPNEKAARFANVGAYPDDLSRIAQIRGAAYIRNLLLGYEDAPEGVVVPEGKYYNPVFPGKQISMAAPLGDDYEYPDGTEATLAQMASDVAAFLSWTVFSVAYYDEYQGADRARVALQGSLAAFMNHGTCIISWDDKWGAKSSATLGSYWNELGDSSVRAVRGALDFNTSYKRGCFSLDTDAANERSKQTTSNGTNEIDISQFKGTAAFKYGLLHGEAKRQTAFLTKWYTLYGYVSYGQGKSISKDNPNVSPGNTYTRTEADAWQVAGGVGLQAQGKICGRYDLNVGYYSGKSESELVQAGQIFPSDGDTNGGTYSLTVDCPLPNQPFYLTGKVRYDDDSSESTTNYGIGAGYNFTDDLRFELDWERTQIESVRNNTVTANMVYDIFKY